MLPLVSWSLGGLVTRKARGLIGLLEERASHPKSFSALFLALPVPVPVPNSSCPLQVLKPGGAASAAGLCSLPS